MSTKKLKKKLKGDTNFNPFNENFDYSIIKEYLKEIETSPQNIDLKLTALNSIFFNQYFEHLKYYFSDLFSKNELSRNAFIEVLITFANRDLYLMSKKLRTALNDKSHFSYDQLTNAHFESSMPELGIINAQAGLEASHDGLNVILNFTNKIENDFSNSKVKFENLDESARLLGFANLYLVIKSSWDMAIWEDFSIKYDKEKNEIKVKCLNEKDQFLNRIGEFRLERNMFSSKMAILSSYTQNGTYYKILSDSIKKSKKTKRLKSVEVKNSEIKYKLADGIEKDSILEELQFQSDLTTYYAFLKNEKLPIFKNLAIGDIISIFSEIQLLFKRAFEIEKIEEENSTGNFDQYRIFIKKYDLVGYLLSKTKFASKDIIQVIDLLSHEKGYYNLWEKPLMNINNKIIPVLLPLLNPNTLRLTDFWLESGGYDIDKRGEAFEEHIKFTLTNELSRKGYYSNAIDDNVIRNKSGQFEEIDLILELDTITIIAEVKCIKFPFDPRDYHNTFKRLSEGVSQVKRKVNFIKNNIKDLSKYECLKKEIVSFVITNYPLFSGFIIDEIPITDFSLLENYFINGALSNGRMIYNKGKLEIDENNADRIQYYKNEKELSENFKSFIENPVPVSEKLKEVSIKETQISLDAADPKILMDYMIFEQSHTI